MSGQIWSFPMFNRIAAERHGLKIHDSLLDPTFQQRQCRQEMENQYHPLHRACLQRTDRIWYVPWVAWQNRVLGTFSPSEFGLGKKQLQVISFCLSASKSVGCQQTGTILNDTPLQVTFSSAQTEIHRYLDTATMAGVNFSQGKSGKRKTS